MTAAVTLNNYHLGDMLGKGASAQVYRALHKYTAETVAVKSISLHSLSPSALPDIMSEIDLLKNLNHPNIVKYMGFQRDKENLFIILEYCENGSLQTILKKFGKFPESLVAVYISQVLEGLIYLHEQGVIHRDIKGANILTNKDGRVKLADFGVSSRSAPGPKIEDDDNEVVGSPYWMAPEVIEQSGASTASDIWSVGCVVVELLEGKPPYGDLAPMQALWRIVQDESMRIPEGASPVVKDFLYHCFQKDPNLRITAKKLLRHPWMQSARKSLEPPLGPQPLSNPVAKDSSSMLPRPTTIRTSSGGSKLVPRDRGNEGTVRARKQPPVYDEAVQQVQKWNEAINSSPKAIVGMVRRLPSASASKRKIFDERAREKGGAPSIGHLGITPLSASRSNATSSGQSGTIQVGPQLIAAPIDSLVQRNQNYRELRSQAEARDDKPWDDDFAPDSSFSKLKNPPFVSQPVSFPPHNHRREDTISEESDQKTLRPSRSPVIQTKSLPGSEKSSMSKSSKALDDYSDIGEGSTVSDLEAKLAHMKLKNKSRRDGGSLSFTHPDQIAKARTMSQLGTSKSSVPPFSTTMGPPPLPKRSLSTPLHSPVAPHGESPTSSLKSNQSSSPSLTLPQSLGNAGISPPGSKQSSLRNKLDTRGLQKEFRNQAEKEDEDFSDMFGDDPGSSLGSLKTRSLQLTKRSDRSWNSDQEEWHDPFAEMEDDLSFGEEDLEAQLLRDKRATLCASVSKNVALLEPNTTSAALKTACDELLSMFQNAPDMGLDAYFVTSHGMLAALELLESRLSRDVAVKLLKIVNYIVVDDLDALESFCLIGGIPVIIPFTSKKHSLECRLEASIFIQQLTKSALTLQMFISCRGLRVLVEMLDEDYSENKSLILSSLEGVGSVFDLQSPTPRNDFCRMFIREGILDPLSTALLAVLLDEEIKTDEPSARAVHVLLLFCQVAQADARVRDAFATRMIMTRLLKACTLLPRKLLLTAIKSIKHLSTSPQLIEILQNSNAMEILVSLLAKSIKGAHANEICSYILQTVYSMTRLSKARQEEASSSGIIPLLKKVIENKSLLKQFALPILCDVANAGKVSRRLLWQNGGMKLYLDLLDDEYWRVSALDAILAWMSDETARVEDVLLEKDASESLVKAFVQASGVSFEGILDPLLKILRLSTSVTSSISTTPFFKRLSEALSHQHKAVVKLNLLRLTRVVCDNHPERATLVSRFDLAQIVDTLAKQDEAILVRELAKEIHPSLLFGNDPPIYHPSTTADNLLVANASIESEEEGRAVMQRSPSEIPPSTTPSNAMLSDKSNGSLDSRDSTRATFESSKIGQKVKGVVKKREGLKEMENRATGIHVDPVGVGASKEERSKHKRTISRSQLKDVQWQYDEQGRMKGVRTPST